ncbi:MAG TPA: PilZ domain-containing protein [Pyrinomonadaceae bacterium]|jgi:hypothetical protein
MPELLRTIVNRLREHVGNRRAAPRYATHLEVALILSVSLGETGSKAQSENSPLRLAGYTRDISETGLALIMPAVHIGGQYLTSPNRILDITLRLPSGPIQLQATPARYSPLDEDAKDTGYIIGVQIKQMSERDKARYQAYLKKLTSE